METFLSVVLVLLLIDTSQSQSSVDNDVCNTPDNSTGTCIIINSCAPIINYIKSLKPPITDQQGEYLRKYQCGVEGSNVKVCCPSKLVPNLDDILTSTTTQRNIVSTVPTITNHSLCRTPDNDTGTCVDIHSCSPILNYLKSIKPPITDQQRTFLLNYNCRTETANVNVCCPTSPINVDPSTTSPAPIRALTSTSDIKHPNINLIPHSICGVLQSDDRVANGMKTTIFEFPWMALISYSNGKGLSFQCGGTLINSRYVLTAAHCITDLVPPQKLAGVRLGEHEISKQRDCETIPAGESTCTDPVQDIHIEEVIPHPDYNRSSIHNDIGLLRLSRSVDLSSESVRPICLPVYEEIKNISLDKAIVTGWGVTENRQTSDILLKANLPIYDHEQCKKIYQARTNITSQMICAGGKNDTDSCKGDSGGPLQALSQINGDIRYVQYGIVSFGWVPCGVGNYPGVYTKVASYLDWILNNIKE